MKVQSKHRIVTPRYTITVWRDEDESYVHQPRGVSKLDVIAHQHDQDQMEVVADELLKLDRVACVEVLDWDRNGIVVSK